MTTDPLFRKLGIYALGDDELAHHLNLPAGQRVLSVSADWACLAVLLMVEGEGLPHVPSGGDVPRLNKWGRLRPLARLTVSDLSPDAAHAAVLAELAGPRLEDPAVTTGRRRTLDRHQPNPTWTAWPGCNHCVNGTAGDPDDWPCEDYLDAAAGLVVGLPGQASREQAITDQQTTADGPAPANGPTLDCIVLGQPHR